MATLTEYLEKVYNERMEGGAPVPTKSSKELETGKGSAGTAETLGLEVYENGTKIKGFVNNQKVDMGLKEFIQKYPEQAKETLSGEQIKKYAADTKPDDFVKNPRTKNKVVKTPDDATGVE